MIKHQQAERGNKSESRGYAIGYRFIIICRRLRSWPCLFKKKLKTRGFPVWAGKLGFVILSIFLFLSLFFISLMFIMGLILGGIAICFISGKKNDVLTSADEIDTDDILQSYENEDGYRSGTEGYGYYVSGFRVDHDEKSGD